MKAISMIRKALTLTSAATLALTFSLPGAYADQGSHAGMKQHAQASASAPVQGMGTVKKVLADKAMIKLKHDPIGAIGWPAMTMNFSAAPSVDLSGYSKGQAVHFTLEKQADGNYLITDIMSMGGMKH